MRRFCAVLAMLLLMGAACSDGSEQGRVGGATTALSPVEPDPFDLVVEAVLALPPDDVFFLLGSLEEAEYAALIGAAGVTGDVEFYETLDTEKARLLAGVIEDDLFDGLATTGRVDVGGSPGGPPNPPSTPAVAADVRQVSGGSLGLRGVLEVPVEPGDISFLAYARTGDPDALVFVTRVLSPFDTDLGDAIGLHYGELTNFGEAAFYAPMAEEIELEPGTYRVFFEASSTIVDSGAFVRSGDPDAPQALDVVFWMATNEDYDEAELETRFREVGAEVFEPHEISVGTMTFVDPPRDVLDRHAVLRFEEGGGDADLRALCRDMSSAIGPVRALNFAIVDRLDGDDPDYVIEGSASGLPGTALLAGSDLPCVAGMAAPDDDLPGRDLLARAKVIWHEAGHHLGLFHTTEEDGLAFDYISDTPECRASERDGDLDGMIDWFECSGLDGSNLMFFDGEGSELTEGQAWVLRRHPLLYPVGE